MIVLGSYSICQLQALKPNAIKRKFLEPEYFSSILSFISSILFVAMAAQELPLAAFNLKRTLDGLEMCAGGGTSVITLLIKPKTQVGKLTACRFSHLSGFRDHAQPIPLPVPPIVLQL
jgi:hypothetical protein